MRGLQCMTVRGSALFHALYFFKRNGIAGECRKTAKPWSLPTSISKSCVAIGLRARCKTGRISVTIFIKSQKSAQPNGANRFLLEGVDRGI